jgi:predicted Zn-dependent protease
MSFARNLVLLCFALFAAACSPAIRFQPGEIPTPGASSPEDIQLSKLVYDTMIAKAPLLRDPGTEARVSRVMDKLLRATPQTGHWSLALIDDPMFNAMAMPGNHIFLFRGMLDSLKSDDEVAAVLAHEIGHRLALHEQKTSGEKLGEALAGLTAAALAAAVAMDENSTAEDVSDTLESAQALGAGFTTLRYSKDKEREADQIGMFLMADAGFDPGAAAKVWASRLAAEGDNSHDFFSTHPLHEDRYNAAVQLLPMAQERYRKAKNLSGESLRKASPRRPDPQLFVELDQAQKALDRGDLRSAETIANMLTQRDPQFVMGYNILGIVRIREGNAHAARAAFATALEIEPDNATLIYNTACTHALSGNPTTALPLLERSFSLDPELLETAKDDSDLSSLGSDPRFQELLSRQYLPQPPANVGGNTFSIN